MKCVHALLQQSIAGEMEILVIDNHSDTDALGILQNRLKGLPNVRLLESNKNAGFGGGYAVGIRQARGTYLLLNNPAKILEPDAVKKMIDRMERDPSIGIVAPKLMHDDGTVRSSARAFPHLFDVIAKRLPGISDAKNVRRYLQSDISPNQERTVDWVIGGCLLMKTELMHQLGGFDPRFFLFFEDIDLCRRVHELGKSVLYFPQATAVDRKQRFSDMPVWKLPLKRAGREHIISALKYFWKWRSV
jgi:GT2 family glycosyltransferase